jgi:HSP20 family protein
MNTLLNYNRVPAFFGGFYGRPAVVRYEKPTATIGAVNVKETETAFELAVVAPGLKKEAFAVNVENNTLTIGYKDEQKTDEKTETYTRHEFSVSTFERSFKLPTTVNTDQIQATYTDGILNVTLPKVEVPAPTVKAIAIL